MKKRAIREPSCQPQVTVQLPLPVLSRLRAVREGFFELCLRVGEQALDALMEQDRTELCGPKWARQPSRQAGRGGSTASEITLGGRRIRVRRLRAAAVDGRELALPSFLWAAERDPLDAQTWRAIVAGVSTRKYGATLEPVPDTFTARSTSRSAVSRRFVALSQQQLTRCLSRPLSDLDLRVVMIDGIDYHDHTILIALGIDGQGRKHVLGVREGTTENSAVAGALLSDLVDRGLNAPGPPAVRHRRRQGAAHGHPSRVRNARRRPPLSGPQIAQRPGAPAGGAAALGATRDAAGVRSGHIRSLRAAAAGAPGGLVGPGSPWGRGVLA